jgi:hypothetical protein
MFLISPLSALFLIGSSVLMNGVLIEGIVEHSCLPPLTPLGDREILLGSKLLILVLGDDRLYLLALLTIVLVLEH